MRREEGKPGMPGHVSCSWPRASTWREVSWSHGGHSLPSSPGETRNHPHSAQPLPGLSLCGLTFLALQVMSSTKPAGLQSWA